VGYLYLPGDMGINRVAVTVRSGSDIMSYTLVLQESPQNLN